MNPIPTPQDVRDKLSALSHAQVLALAERTAVPFTTLWKVRTGETKNPRLETVFAIWPELMVLDAPAAAADQCGGARAAA